MSFTLPKIERVKTNTVLPKIKYRLKKMGANEEDIKAKDDRFKVESYVHIGIVAKNVAYEFEWSNDKLCDSDLVRRFNLKGFKFTEEGAKELCNHLFRCVSGLDMTNNDLKEVVKKAPTDLNQVTGSWVYVPKSPKAEWNEVRRAVIDAVNDFLGQTYNKIRHVVGLYRCNDVYVVETKTRYTICDSVLKPSRDQNEIGLISDDFKNVISYTAERHDLEGDVLYTNDSLFFLVPKKPTKSALFKDMVRGVVFVLDRA